MIEHDEVNDPIVRGEIELFRAIWHSSSDNMFIVKEENGEFISEKVNDSLLKTFNLKEEHFTNVPLKYFLDKKSYKEVKKMYQKCINTQKPISYEESHILENMGKTYWNTTILSVKDSKTTRIFGISRNITKLKKLNEQLEFEVNKRTSKLKKALVELEKISVTDKLTKLYNRHKTDKVLAKSIRFAKRYKSKFGVILLDIDNFKSINDNYGHHTGDKVLKELSSLLKSSVRESDTLGRWGGEEFLIIVPNASKKSLITLANNLKEIISSYEFSDVKKVTASFGATLYKKSDTSENLIIKVDEALYKAKKRGKNRVVLG